MLTKKSIQIYASEEDRLGTEAYRQARSDYIHQAWVDGKGDNVVVVVEPGVAELHWLDQETADAWKAWVIDAAASYGSVLLSVTIADLDPPIPV